MQIGTRLVICVGLVSGVSLPSAMAQTLDAAFVVARQPNVVTVMQQQCHQVQVPIQSNPHSVGGGVLGGVIGAAIGNQIGRGDGKTVATAVGAVLGSQIGSQPTQAAGYELKNVCNTVPMQFQNGETVTFEYRGRRFTQSFRD
jgi:uncharacterized protein YcfJ